MIRNIIPEDHNFIAQLSRAFNRFGPYEQIFMSMLKGIAPPGVIGNVNLFIHLNIAGQQQAFSLLRRSKMAEIFSAWRWMKIFEERA